MFDFIYHGVELISDLGDKLIWTGFAGLSGLMQYACPDSKQLKIDALKTIHDAISETMNGPINERNSALQNYLQSLYQCILTNISENGEDILDAGVC